MPAMNVRLTALSVALSLAVQVACGTPPAAERGPRPSPADPARVGVATAGGAAAPSTPAPGRDPVTGEPYGTLRGDLVADSPGFAAIDVVPDGTIGLGSLAPLGAGGVTDSYAPERLAATIPSVAVGAPTVAGPMSADVVRRIIRRHVAELQRCYAGGLEHDAVIGTHVSLTFVIGPAGLVTEASTSGVGDPLTEACFAGAMRQWVFPAPLGGGIVRVVYPLTLKPPTARPAARR
jgi:hypothetical protein